MDQLGLNARQFPNNFSWKFIKLQQIFAKKISVQVQSIMEEEKKLSILMAVFFSFIEFKLLFWMFPGASFNNLSL